MPEFLELLPPAKALGLFIKALPPASPEVEEIPTASASGRVLAVPVAAAEPLPGFTRSTVDGYAVFAADTFGASDSLPVYLSLAGEVAMGRSPDFELNRTQAALIHTGGMLPEGADAVVMVEMTQNTRAGEIEVMRAVAVGENILRAGEDVSPGSEVIPRGTLIRAMEIGGLAALGVMTVRVAHRPRIGILSSGDEVVPPDRNLRPGQVRDVNSYTLAALVEKEGGEPVLYGIIKDTREDLERAVRQALKQCDAVVITAGSSASTRDLTAQVIQKMGEPGVLVHGVNVKPGKPTILGVCNGKAVIGLPGNPVSALVIARIFVLPVLHYLLGMENKMRSLVVSARLAVNLASQAGREDWVPVRLKRTARGLEADPIFYKSNLIFSLVRADGLVHIPADANGLEAGERVEVEIL